MAVIGGFLGRSNKVSRVRVTSPLVVSSGRPANAAAMKRPGCLLWFVLMVTGCCGPTAAAAESDWHAVVCDSARPYHGPKPHPAPERRVFTDAAPSFGAGLDTNAIARLERALDKAQSATKAPAMTVAVGVPGRGVWSATRGTPGDTNAPPRWFWFASVGKAFTAAVVLQLVEEGKLSLDDPLSRWFPDFPNAKAITLDHLLRHTGGIYSFQNDPKLRVQPGYHAPEELIGVARAHGNGFCPGEYWSYSNTGYVLLGLIVERVEGRPFHEVVDTRVIRRLGLVNTRALAPQEELPGLARPSPSRPTEEPVGSTVPTTPYAAGNVVATAGDMVRFWHALLAGELLKPATVRNQFAELLPMFDPGTFYGRGVMLYDVPDKDGRHLTWLGHSGGAPGSKALVLYSVESKAYVAVAMNNDGSAEATANLLLKALNAEP